jgi:hypothetical protein
MKPKIDVVLCTGPYCHAEAATQLSQLNRMMPAKLRSQINLCGALCGGQCTQKACAIGPIVKVGDNVIPNASCKEVIKTLKEALKQPRLEPAAA